ncbi:MAG: pilus assembly protein PilP [Desulfococcaceae bacterium]|jgi:type IV pilus assembly protein PilP|nr:pilus assembly protein PilP [Desulfococcaceae bacterium]
MKKHPAISDFIFALLLIFTAGTIFCACQEQTSAPPPENKSIRKKLSVRPKPPEGEKEGENINLADADSGTSSEKNAAPEKGEGDKAGTAEKEDSRASGKQRDKADKSAPETESGIKTAKAPDTENAAENAADREGEAPPSPEESAADASAAEENESLAAISDIAGQDGEPLMLTAYDPKGKADPFEPLFKEEPKEKKKTEVASAQDSSKPKTPPRRLTPLEKLDLDQLKLVGIIRAESGNKALVEEASGKGYIIVKGTYIGIRSGIVVEIKQDRIVVEEKEEDVLGKVIVRKRELKFNRPEEDYYEM